MQRFIVYSALAMSLVACKAKESDDDDDEFGSWTEGGAQDLPGGATDLPGDNGNGDSDGNDDDADGNLGGLDDGGSSGGETGGSSGGGSSAGSGSGSGSVDGYAGGYPINPCASTPSATGTRVGDISPDWALQDQYGESVRLSDFCGSVVLMESVAFW